LASEHFFLASEHFFLILNPLESLLVAAVFKKMLQPGGKGFSLREFKLLSGNALRNLLQPAKLPGGIALPEFPVGYDLEAFAQKLRQFFEILLRHDLCFYFKRQAISLENFLIFRYSERG